MKVLKKSLLEIKEEHKLKNLSDFFVWLANSGVLIAAVTFAATCYKAIYPAFRSRIKNRQQQQLMDSGLAIVTKFATLQALSKTDRFNEASKELSQFAKIMHINWVTPEIAATIIEDAYQTFKLSGKDNHSPIETPVSDEEIDRVINGDGSETPSTASADTKTGNSEKGVTGDGQ